MDLQYSEDHEQFRAEVREFLTGWPLRGDEAALPPKEQQSLFRNRAIERGFVYRDIPREYGGGGQEPDVLKDHIIREEFGRAGAPGNSFFQGPAMLAPTLMEFGTEAQRKRFVPPTLREETPVRMDLTHSGWSDIFFLGMDFPEGARVINTFRPSANWNTSLPRPGVPGG